MGIQAMNGSNNPPALGVYSQSEHVGTLTFSEPSLCTFVYSDQWVSNRFPISPCINLNGQFSSQSVTRFLRNLFPEGDAFDLLLQNNSLSKTNLYAILNTIGHETTGALSFFDTAYQAQQTQLRPVDEQELIAKLSTGSAEALVTWDGKYRLSVAGVQNKLNVYMDEQSRPMLADGAYSSTHILKFASATFPSIVINELVCMRLARDVGLNVANVTYKNYGGYDSLIVERFDRKRVTDGVQKRHMIDACQALDLPPEFKYEQNYGSGRDVRHIKDGVSFKKLFAFAKTCNVPAITIQNLLDWMIFNIVIGNSDAHGKNVSFFVGNNGITITPFYDLVCVVYEASRNSKIDTMAAMGIDDNFDLNTITAFDLLSIAEESSISFPLLKTRCTRLTSAIIKAVKKVDLNDCNLDAEQINTEQAIKQLIFERATNMLKQLGHLDLVAKEHF
jgi:serine/threonine-protein kinase HipA